MLHAQSSQLQQLLHDVEFLSSRLSRAQARASGPLTLTRASRQTTSIKLRSHCFNSTTVLKHVSTGDRHSTFPARATTSLLRHSTNACLDEIRRPSSRDIRLCRSDPLPKLLALDDDRRPVYTVCRSADRCHTLLSSVVQTQGRRFALSHYDVRL
jgi:hypothetical protein